MSNMSLQVIHSGAEARMCASEFEIAQAQWIIMENSFKDLRDQIEASKNAAITMGEAAYQSALSQGQQQIVNGIGQIGGGAITAGCTYIGNRQAESIDSKIQLKQSELTNTEEWKNAFASAQPARVAPGEDGADPLMAQRNNRRAAIEDIEKGNFSVRSVTEEDRQDISLMERVEDRRALEKKAAKQAVPLREDLKDLREQKQSVTSTWSSRGQIASSVSQGFGSAIAGHIATSKAIYEQNRALAQYITEAFSTLMKTMMDIIQIADQRRQQTYQQMSQAVQANYRG